MNNNENLKILQKIGNLIDNHGLDCAPLREISLMDFVNKNAETIRSELTKTLKCDFKGLKNPHLYTNIMEILKSFNRTPFPRQARLIASAVEYFTNKKNLIISAEMGSGKTLMALCIVMTHLYLKKKGGNIAIMCPSHLKDKWEEEINLLFKGIFNNIEIIQVKSGGDILKYKNKIANKIRFFIFSKEVAKLGYKLTEAKSSILTPIFGDDGEMVSCLCPYCGTYFDPEEREKTRERYEQSRVKKIQKRVKITENDTIKAEHLTCKKCAIQTNAILSNNVVPLGKLLWNKKEVWSKNNLSILEKPLSFNRKNIKGSNARKLSVARAVKQLPKGFFEFFIADEIHELKGETGQGEAFARIATHAKHTIGLTGTILNGYASSLYLILYRLFPRLMKEDLELNFKKGQSAFIEEFGGFKIEYSNNIEEEGMKNGVLIKRSGNKIVNKSEHPVINPKIIRILLKHMLFLRLDEMNVALPNYVEEVITVPLDKEVEEPYSSYMRKLRDEIISNKNTRLLGTLCSHGLSIPDNPSKAVFYHNNDGLKNFYFPPVSSDFINNKDKKLASLIQEEYAQNRKVLVYVTFVDGMLERLKRVVDITLKEKGLNLDVKCLSSSVEVSKRQKWIKDNPCDVLIVNAELVKTGLDLLEYPTIIFYQTGFITSTLEQASRRSWRLGQKNECRVFFLVYQNTAQFNAILLMSRKIKASNNLRGRLIAAKNELSNIAESDTNMQKAIANAIIANNYNQEQIANKWVYVAREDDPFESLYKKIQKIVLKTDFIKNTKPFIQEIKKEVLKKENQEKNNDRKNENENDSGYAIGTILVKDKSTNTEFKQMCFLF